MRILVIPDIHLKTWIFDRAEDILKASKADQAVCLMDMGDETFHLKIFFVNKKDREP